LISRYARSSRVIQQPPEPRKWILVLLDADDELPCELGPRLESWARDGRPDIHCSCVVANREYETWFAASAESLIARGLVRPEARISEQPETDRLSKGWAKRWISKATYSETTDQAKFTAALDIGLTRRRAPSFDKLCRELEAVARASG
jgi:hypothetical protein